VKRVPFEIAEYPEMRGKKIQDVYISMYKVHETTFSDQTGQFPTSIHLMQGGEVCASVNVGGDTKN
jgi:hypothetical protein